MTELKEKSIEILAKAFIKLKIGNII